MDRVLLNIVGCFPDIIKSTLSLESRNSLGLYNGAFGNILFISHYLHKYPRKELEDQFQDYLEKSLEKLCSEPILYTYCGGLAGIFKCLEYLKKTKLLNIDYSEIDKAYESFLLNRMTRDLKRGNYDFMHGGLGIALYYLGKKDFDRAAVEGLDHIAIHDGNTIKWKTDFGIKGEIAYNTSLSHGMSSIIIYLSLLIRNRNAPEKTEDLMEKAINFILSLEGNPEERGYFFPSIVDKAGVPSPGSRMAWCYGDLGAAAALWQAGKAVNNETWKEKALRIMKFSTSRRNLEKNNVNDPGICHGAAGLAMMFQYFYQETGDSVYLETSRYWLEETLKMSRFEDGLAGYKVYDFTNRSWKNESSLLEGVAGIGLILLSATQDQKWDWINLFLLS